jgi:predicted amidohydrolase
MGSNGLAGLSTMAHTNTPPDLRVALWQTPHASDPELGLHALDRAAAQARAQGADLIVTPEMFCSGYAVGAPRLAAWAQHRDGAWAQAVGQIARQHGLAVVYGYPERHPNGAPYNAVQIVDPSGHTGLHYRKTHLYGGLDQDQFQAGPDRATVLLWRGWCLGVLICYDVEFPETVRDLAAQGADVVLVPTANMCPFDEVQDILLPARALENRVYVAYANACGQEGPYVYNGRSTVCGPQGERLLMAHADEGLFTVPLSASALALARQRPYLSDRRLDLFGQRPDRSGQTVP